MRACGVCRTDLHVLDGELPDPKLPLVLGHEIVGEVMETGRNVAKLSVGQRVGIPWLGLTCGCCVYCRNGHENLCENARFTGYTLDGGYAEFAVADQHFCFRCPMATRTETRRPTVHGADWLSPLVMAGDARRLGIYGFGAAAHIIAQVARHQGREVFAFTRQGDEVGQDFARELGASWAGDSTVAPPEPLDAALIFAPVGSLVPQALSATAKGGTVVCAGIHMSDIPSFPYRLLWEERTVRSVANLTRRDGEEFLALPPKCRSARRSKPSRSPLPTRHSPVFDRAKSTALSCCCLEPPD